MIGVPSGILEDHATHTVGIRIEREGMDVVEEEHLTFRRVLQGPNDVAIAPQDVRRFRVSVWIRIE